MSSFEDFKLNRQFLNAIEEAGYTQPTPIQEKAIPLAMAGHDLIGIAQTGTGKTASFVLPLLMKLKYAQGKDPRAIILAPTKELVMQISENVEQLSTYTDLRHVALYGGVGPKTQLEKIEEGVDILVATPGRLMDIYSRGGLVLKHVKTMVMDEADRLMDMGFMPQIRSILEVIPSKKRQNLLFSATFPPKVEHLSEEFLEFPERVEVTPQATPVETVKQLIYEVPNFRTKVHLLEHLLQDVERFNRVIVFVNTRTTADNIFKFLERKVEGNARVIHANKGQNSRINAIKEFGEGKIRLLVATDVTARGIDIDQVSHVINFDVPHVYEDYVHRIGRTGRAYNVGEAIAFVNKAEKYYIEGIEELIRMRIPVESMPSEVPVTDTPKQENIDMERLIDKFKRKADPTFKGAFHEKKKKPSSKKVQGKAGGKKRKTKHFGRRMG